MSKRVTASEPTLASLLTDVVTASEGDHIERVCRYALLLAQQIAPELAHDPRVEYGFALHDLGMITVPSEIRRSDRVLSATEWAHLRKHVEVGASMLEAIPNFEPAREIVLYHHERWDGTGYLHGLQGEEIPLPARLFSVCDAFDAMTSNRPYRPARTAESTLAVLEEGASRQWDPVAVSAFVGLVQSGHLANAPPLSIPIREGRS